MEENRTEIIEEAMISAAEEQEHSDGEEERLTAEEDLREEDNAEGEDAEDKETEDDDEDDEEDEDEPNGIFICRVLASAMEEYWATGKPLALTEVLSSLLYMIYKDISVYVPAEPGTENDGSPVIRPTVLQSGKEEKYIVIQPVPDDHFDFMVTMKMIKVFSFVYDHDDLKGIVLDPYGENIQISRSFVVSVIELAGHMFRCGKEKAEEESSSKAEAQGASKKPEGVSFSVNCSCPMPEESFTGVGEALHSLRDLPYEHVTVSFTNSEPEAEALFIQAARCGGTEDGEPLYHAEIAFDMSDFEWDHPLILARDGLTFEETVGLFHDVCVSCIPTDKIPLVKGFRDIGFGEE